MKVFEFKANCIAVLARGGKSKPLLLITRLGESVAKFVPPSAPCCFNCVGNMKESGKILSDIVAPAADPEGW